MLALPLNIGNPKDEQFYIWTKVVLTIFLLMNSIQFQMSKHIFVGFRITLVGLVNYSPTACHLPQLHQCRKCVSCRSCRLEVLERLVTISFIVYRSRPIYCLIVINNYLYITGWFTVTLTNLNITITVYTCSVTEYMSSVY